MALTSESQPSPKGVNCIEQESAEILNDEDLEDGEIFEDEEASIETKSAVAVPPEKKSAQTGTPVLSHPQKKLSEPEKNHRSFENDKPVREQNVPFFNKGKRKHFENDEEDSRWKRDKRNRRSHEFEREGESRKMRHDGDLGEDEEEMVFVRGASPHRMDEDMDKWDCDGDDEERNEVSRRTTRSYRGRGNLGRRGDQRSRGRGRGRGNMRGNKRKRDDPETCVFYMQGKCHRGSECPYAHEILPPRKMELCKFYMKDCCAKKDKCLYMHSEFPCKYFHTGLKCFANKKCKFSHAQLNDTFRNILAKHLNTAPKDILGEWPRREPIDQRDRGDMRGDRDMRGDSRDMRGDLRGEFMRNKNERERKIPSLFDIKVTIPDEMRSTDGSQTPMPSPTQRSQDSTTTRSSDRDRDYSPDREKQRDRERDRDREREREREHEKHKHDKLERSKERKAKREKAREHRKERKERREKEKKRDTDKEGADEKSEHLEQDNNKNQNIMSPTQLEDSGKNIAEVPLPTDKTIEEQDRRGFSYEENGLIPQHLPKKQRELFLRIQQQQREAENSQASTNEDDDEDAGKAAEENWYSSDEETTSATPLPPILQNLTHSTGMSSSFTTTTTTSNTVMPLLNLLATASASAKPLEVNKTPASTTPFIPPNLDLANLSTVFEALSNLQKMNSSANMATKQETLTMNVAEPVVESPKVEPPKPEIPRVRDPRLRSDAGSIDSHRRSIEGPLTSDIDLRLKAQAKAQPPSTDVDLRSLPFKPVQHSAASEIDASLSSHSPITWQLIPAEVMKADYTGLQIQPRPGVNDPRLRRIVRPPTDELGLPRDPRQRLIDEPVRDPRARQPLLATPLMPPNPLLAGPPPTPRYDEDHRPQFYHMDSDMRHFPPPTPRMEEEIYTPGPSRPVDPRQRNMSFDDPRRNQFPSRSDDIDLRPNMAHRVPFNQLQ